MYAVNNKIGVIVPTTRNTVAKAQESADKATSYAEIFFIPLPVLSSFCLRYARQSLIRSRNN